jgi:hypothetical protein
MVVSAVVGGAVGVTMLVTVVFMVGAEPLPTGPDGTGYALLIALTPELESTLVLEKAAGAEVVRVLLPAGKTGLETGAGVEVATEGEAAGWVDSTPTEETGAVGMVEKTGLEAGTLASELNAAGDGN